jgi:predicted secreted hydrolase
MRPAHVTFGLLTLLSVCGEPEPGGQVRLSLLETLGGSDTVGYARAMDPRLFDFPADHGPHDDFRTEWWYATGNLTSAGDRDFGFQLTMFRSALAPRAPATESEWGTNQAYMAHFAVTDVARREFAAFERFARGAVGLAGATAEPLRVWLEDWALEGAPSSTFPLRLRAAEGGIALELALEPSKPIVLQGHEGLSQKGPQPGNASYYYSFTRLSASGKLMTPSDTFPVTGTAWLDREWSTSALAEGVVGWDWFALQLDDGWELMIYRLRRADGSADPFSDGALVDPQGQRVPLEWGRGVTLESTGRWTSPVDGAMYPSGWRIRVPGRGWDLTVDPLVPGQELDLAFRYWEGAVNVRGSGEGGAEVQGRGYVELTGYAGALPTR